MQVPFPDRQEQLQATDVQGPSPLVEHVPELREARAHQKPQAPARCQSATHRMLKHIAHAHALRTLLNGYLLSFSLVITVYCNVQYYTGNMLYTASYCKCKLISCYCVVSFCYL